MLYMVATNKYFSYNEMDINHDGFIGPFELLYYTDVCTMVEYNNETNTSCVFEVFAPKDTFTLKEFPMDCNSTVYPVPPAQCHYDRR